MTYSCKVVLIILKTTSSENWNSEWCIDSAKVSEMTINLLSFLIIGRRNRYYQTLVDFYYTNFCVSYNLKD